MIQYFYLTGERSIGNYLEQHLIASLAIVIVLHYNYCLPAATGYQPFCLFFFAS